MGGDEQDRRRGMLRADDVDDVRQRDGELFDHRIPAVVKHIQRRILDVGQHGGDFRLATSIAGEAKIDDFTVQHAGKDVSGAHARTCGTSALRDGCAVHDSGTVIDERCGCFQFGVVIKSDGEGFDAVVEWEVDDDIAHVTFQTSADGRGEIALGMVCASHAEAFPDIAAFDVDVEASATREGHVVHAACGG